MSLYLLSILCSTIGHLIAIPLQNYENILVKCSLHFGRDATGIHQCLLSLTVSSIQVRMCVVHYASFIMLKSSLTTITK